ncbi:hypothetical protein K450DRAFT_222278 [Umbelopsis ramanniana AG]|uniref:Uncharacterized protein n=1 Tax=Umbelopsis ramanniana AG TaxID=1314678 RepID=A0AAD5HIW0_UMBRA|nr:uncharacterized protein K450DRAFT_222278 [Umbelopsis ramanniana AG]KAI8583683.1 hypothetical protein K450DRAFT_222278 [Umbelopsis ramanniana AG]
MEQLTTLDYLTNSVNAALEVQAGCYRYWTNIILVYTAGFLSSLLIMVVCLFVLRMYLNELQDFNADYVSGINQTMQDVEEEYKPMVPDFKYRFYKQDPTEDTNRDLYDNRSALYSKIYQKNVLRKDHMKQSLAALHPPEYTPQPNIKSPTLERMQYSQFKEHGASHVPLEREGMNNSAGEPLPSNPSDPPADPSDPLVDTSDVPADQTDSTEPENDRLLGR